MLFDDESVLREHASYGKRDSIFHDDNDSQVERLYNSSPPLLEQIPFYEMETLFAAEPDDKRYQVNEDVDPITNRNISDNLSDSATASDAGDTETGTDTFTLSARGTLPPRDSHYDSTPGGGGSSLPASASAAAGGLLDASRTGTGGASPNNADKDKDVTGSGDSGKSASSVGKSASAPGSLRGNRSRASIAKGPKISALTQILATSSVAEQQKSMRLTIYLPDFSMLKIDLEETCTFGRAIVRVLALHKEKGLTPALAYTRPQIYELCMHEGDGEPDRDFTFEKHKKVMDHYNPRRPDVNEYCLCESEDEPTTHCKSKDSESTLGVADVDAMENTVLVTIPSAAAVGNLGSCGNLFFHFTNTMKLRDLLPLIAQKHKIAIFTEFYSFLISSEDQARLKLMSNIVDNDTYIVNIGTKKFALHKRVFQDNPKMQGIKRRPTIPLGGAGMPHGGNVPFFNQAVNTAYQEWNVIKKNDFGRRQERVLGMDALKIYNHKRGEMRGQSDVRHPDRDITTILNVTSMGADSSAFKIHFSDAHVHDIEYTCASIAEKNEIMTKLNFIRARNAKAM